MHMLRLEPGVRGGGGEDITRSGGQCTAKSTAVAGPRPVRHLTYLKGTMYNMFLWAKLVLAVSPL